MPPIAIIHLIIILESALRPSEIIVYLGNAGFITSNIYPTYTYADDPARFVAGKAAREGFADAVNLYAKKLYLILDGEASGPWFLGDRFSALDIYIYTMTRWRPKRPWFDANAPTLAAIADATRAVPRLAQVWAKNFPET